MNFQKQLILTVTFLLFFTAPVLGANLTVITPYRGTEENSYTNTEYGLKLKDSQETNGLYIQSINPEKYQWNVFLYRTTDINHSDLWGVNFIYDYYFGKAGTKNVIGFGMNYLNMDLAGEGIPAKAGNLDALKLDLTVFSPYIRLGKYYNFNEENFHCTLLPWIGGEVDQSRGSGLADFPGPGATVFEIRDEQYFWLAGLNLKINFAHFLELEAKRSAVYNADYFLNKGSAIANLFLTRNVALSYRYNYQETITGKDIYNILGIAAVF